MFDWFEQLVGRAKRKLKSILEGGTKSVQPPIHFTTVLITETPPPIDAINGDSVYVVAKNSIGKWAMFQCPCGCGEVITLSLQPAHKTRWALEINPSGRANFHPSVWRNIGCKSHFWLKDGRVYWA